MFVVCCFCCCLGLGGGYLVWYWLGLFSCMSYYMVRLFMLVDLGVALIGGFGGFGWFGLVLVLVCFVVWIYCCVCFELTCLGLWFWVCLAVIVCVCFCFGLFVCFVLG